MVISFEEKYRATIEAQGISIIEFKYALHEITKVIINDVNDFMDKFNKALSIISKAVAAVVDFVKLLHEEMRETRNYPTSIRYRVVKVLSRCTGIEKYNIWKMTRHTWLARSCC